MFTRLLYVYIYCIQYTFVRVRIQQGIYSNKELFIFGSIERRKVFYQKHFNESSSFKILKSNLIHNLFGSIKS